jgi:hypothetical protein
MPSSASRVDQLVVLAVGEVVHVLHAHDRRDRLCLGDLFRRRVADSEVPDQALLLEFDERLEWLSERAGLGSLCVAEPEVDQVEHLKAEGFKILVDGAAQIFWLTGWGASRPAGPGRAGQRRLASVRRRLRR